MSFLIGVYHINVLFPNLIWHAKSITITIIIKPISFRHIPDDVIRRRFANRFECLARVLPLCDGGTFVETFEDYRYNIASLFFGGKLYDFNLNERKWVSEFLAYYPAHGGQLWD